MYSLFRSSKFFINKLASGIFILLIAGFVQSCENDISTTDSYLNDIPPPTITDSIFEKIHSQIYDNPSLSREHSLKLLASLKVDDPVSRIKLLKYIGSSYVFETKYPDAIDYYNQALSLAEEINLYSEIANIHNNLGTVLNESGSYISAYIHFVAALENYDLAGASNKNKGTLNNIGLAYINLNNHKKALDYFEKALDSTLKVQNPILYASILNNIAICNGYGDNTVTALMNLEHSIKISEQNNNQYGLCISYQIMGDLYEKSGDIEHAFSAYTISNRIARESSLYNQTAFSKIGISKVFLEWGQNEESLNLAIEVMEMAEEKKSIILKKEAHFMLSKIYKKKKEFQKSLAHFEMQAALKEEMSNNTIMNQVYDVEFKYLDQLNKMQQLEIDKKGLVISKKNNLLFLLLLVFILLLAGSYLAYRSNHHKQGAKLRDTIIEMNQKKSNAALQAEISERKRIGKNLHDSLGYLLSLAGLHASVLQERKNMPEEKRNQLLKTLMESIDDAFDEVRNISHNLAPSLLSSLGLNGALKNIRNKVNQTSKLKMSYNTFGLEENLDTLIENLLYRSIQEIVNNTIKHAEATELFLQIAQDDKEITLLAEDNGKGFDFEILRKDSSFGLSHIKSGVENLNGTIFIDSKPERGTIISIVIPL